MTHLPPQYRKSLLQEAPDLVKKMASLGLVSYPDSREISNPREITAIKQGMTVTEYHRRSYAKKKARLASR